MIPHVIHYCWFGGKPLPKSALKCISSWKKYFPDWEIKQWNEENFDINSIPYTREAAERGKWAFVSDYARFWILYHHGGVYFDTDVEVIRPMDDIIEGGAFMGFEKDCNSIGIAAGLGMGANKKLGIYKEIIEHYSSLHFIDEVGNQLPGTVVKHVTDVFIKHGLILHDKTQIIRDVTIFQNEYFNPLDDATGVLKITPNTRSIHHYAKTWCDNYGPVRTRVMRLLHRTFGVNAFSWIRKLIS
ncbi:MAG: glycosyl transferase [Muribaculaceae bacterium]|nr:glycosyl transferase [Muribaculaceae bacterium]